MRVLVVGAGRVGARVLGQLQKNPSIQVITLDPRERPYAIEKGIIKHVDVSESLTPLSLQFVLEQTRPDLILMAADSQDMSLGKAPGVDLLAESLREELAALSTVPLVEVART